MLVGPGSWIIGAEVSWGTHLGNGVHLSFISASVRRFNMGVIIHGIIGAVGHRVASEVMSLMGNAFLEFQVTSYSLDVQFKTALFDTSIETSGLVYLEFAHCFKQ